MYSWACPQRKTCCPFIEGVTHFNISATSFSTQGSYGDKYRHSPSGSCSFSNVQKSCQKTLQRMNRKQRLIHSRLSNCYVKLHLAQAGTDAQALSLSCQMQPLFSWYNWLSGWLISPCESVRLFVVSEYESLTLYGSTFICFMSIRTIEPAWLVRLPLVLDWFWKKCIMASSY